GDATDAATARRRRSCCTYAAIASGTSASATRKAGWAKLIRESLRRRRVVRVARCLGAISERHLQRLARAGALDDDADPLARLEVGDRGADVLGDRHGRATDVGHDVADLQPAVGGGRT